MPNLPISRVVLYKHGVGYFERQGSVTGEANLSLTFKQTEVSDVLKSLTVLDLDGGHIASVSYDSTKPLEQLLADVALDIPDHGSLVHLLPQIKGVRVALHSGVSDPIEGAILGIDYSEKQTGDGISKIVLLSILTDHGDVRSFDLHNLFSVQILDPTLRRDLEFYLKTQLSAKKKDSRTFTFFAQGEGERTIRLSYLLEAPVWKATYRILLNEPDAPATIQGWAVVDNTQDEDWENVNLSLVAGLPVSFIHDLYTPRYIRRPVVQVQETTGVLPPTMEDAMMLQMDANGASEKEYGAMLAAGAAAPRAEMRKMAAKHEAQDKAKSGVSSMPSQVRERKLGDLFEYEIQHPVTIRRNQSALVPIVLKPFEGRPVLLYNKANRGENPMRSVELKNTTGLTLEGGPVTVLEEGSYVGEAMLDTLKPDEQRLVPYAVELGVAVLDNIESHNDRIHRVVVRRGRLQTFYLHSQKTSYHFNNKSDAEQIVYLEHPRPGDWNLFETAEPVEITENYWRFRFTIPAKKVTAFVVQQRRTLANQHTLTDLTDQQLAVWIDQKFLDAKLTVVFRQAAELRQETVKIDQAVKQLEVEKNNIHAEQKRIRDNLASLGEKASEKDLRERYIRTLHDQEDRLEKIEQETKTLREKRQALSDRLDALIAALEYDAEV